MLIKMPTWSRSKAVIIHEIAHHCADEAYGVSDVAAHGWQFAATFLELATHELGAESGDALKKSFKEHRVRYRAPRQRKPLTPEQRAVLVERMAAARDAKAHRAWAAKIG
jgi:Spy/CpxP family protein refolding chaperone